MKKSELFTKVSRRKAKGVRIRRSLCFYNPEQVYDALLSNMHVRTWLRRISNHYIPPKRDVLLLYPCSTDKPYHRSRSYQQLHDTLLKVDPLKKRIHVVTISEPFGLVPEEYHATKKIWYDCPGLFKWWCSKHGQSYSKEHLEKSIEILSVYVEKFFIKVKRRKSYSRMIAFVRTYSSGLERKADHTHRRIVESAARKANVRLTLLPTKRMVSNIVKRHGRLAWDLQGVAHREAQGYLLRYLRRVLRD